MTTLTSLDRWQALAACTDADPHLFYPTDPNQVPAAAAKLCNRCPVRTQCLDWALRHEDHGVWGGLSEGDRRRMRRRLRIPFRGISAGRISA